eukprot:2134694-Rhodomonas_salina.5
MEIAEALTRLGMPRTDTAGRGGGVGQRPTGLGEDSAGSPSSARVESSKLKFLQASTSAERARQITETSNTYLM